MATFRTRTGKKGTTVTVMVRIAGYPTQTETFPNKTEAKKWAAKTEADILEGRTSKDALGRKRTLKDAIDRYRKEVVPLMRDGSMYGFTLDWFETHHGEKRLGEISRGWLSEVRGTLLAGTFTRATPGSKRSVFNGRGAGKTTMALTHGFDAKPPVPPNSIIPGSFYNHAADYNVPKVMARSPATCNRYMAALSSVFSQVCGDWQWLQPTSNPFAGFSKLPEGKNKGKAYAAEARYKLLQETAKDPQLHTMTQIALATTARAGELLKLEWANVEIVEPQMPPDGIGDQDIQPGYARLTFVDTKNGETRTAWLFGDALEALRDHKFRWNRDGHIDAAGQFIPGSPKVFPGAWSHAKKAHGKYDYLKPLHEALKRAGLTMKRPFHALRHTAATDMARMGANRHQLKGAGGWKSNAVDVYVHLGNEDTRDLMQRHQARLTQEGK